VYEDGKPAKAPHYLKWNPAGLKTDDLVFVPDIGQDRPAEYRAALGVFAR